jgi:hypothetical protein
VIVKDWLLQGKRFPSWKSRLGISGVFLIAGVLGGITDSWTVFLIALAVLVAISLHDGSLSF